MSLFLVVGSGVREQAIVESLLKDPTTKVHCIGNENYGIERLWADAPIIELNDETN